MDISFIKAEFFYRLLHDGIKQLGHENMIIIVYMMSVLLLLWILTFK